MSEQSNNQGRAYEYICVLTLCEEIQKLRPAIVQINSALNANANAWNSLSPVLQNILTESAKATVGTIFDMEPMLLEEGEDMVVLTCQTDSEGKEGDVRDIVITRKDAKWEIGLSIKHNHFAVKHVVFQQKDKKLLEASNRYFIEQRDALLKKNAVSEVLNVIYNYYELNEEDVVSAVISTCDFLEKDDIPYSEYLKLSNYLISLKYVVECYDLVDKCKNFMIQNIRKASMQNKIKLLHNSGIELHTEDEQKEFAEFEKELKDIADSDNRQWQDYNYTVEEFDEFYGKISKREDRFLSDRAFMQKIDVDKLLQLIPLLETSQISKLRSVFLGRYGYANINEFFMLEKPYLEQLKQGLEELLKQGAFEDKIKANQIKWFISNLENFILKLNK